MSTNLEEKLAPPERQHGSRARAKFHKHLLRDGALKEGADFKIRVGSMKKPEVVEILSMGKTWVWVLHSRDGKDFWMELSGVQLGIPEIRSA